MLTLNFSDFDRALSKGLYQALKSDDKLDNAGLLSKYEDKSSEFKNKVFFTDFMSGQRISINLSDENIANLQNTFTSSQLKQNKDGSYELSGKAQEAVAGWFGDIAYRRGYLRADANGDGILNQNELSSTQSFAEICFGGFLDEKQLYVFYSSHKTYRQASDESLFATYNNLQNTIEKELNRILNLDKDMNLHISFKDVLENVNDYKNSIESRVKDAFRVDFMKPKNSFHSKGISLEGVLPDIKEMLKMLEKLMKELLMRELNLAGDPENYNLDQLKQLVSELNQNTNEKPQENESLEPSFISSIKSEIEMNLSLDISV